MATSNFFYTNVLGVVGCYCDGDTHCDCGSWAEHKIEQDIEKIIHNKKHILSSDSICDNVAPRSSSGHCFGSIYFDYKGLDAFKIRLMSHVGYYEGQNIDYFIEDVDAYNLTDSDYKKARLMVDILGRKVGRIILKHTKQYKVVARFSNGETMYRKVK
jgi:hypothetical protein